MRDGADKIPSTLRVCGEGRQGFRLRHTNASADSVTLQKSSYCPLRLRSHVYSNCFARHSQLSSAPRPGNFWPHSAITNTHQTEYCKRQTLSLGCPVSLGTLSLSTARFDGFWVAQDALPSQAASLMISAAQPSESLIHYVLGCERAGLQTQLA